MFLIRTCIKFVSNSKVCFLRKFWKIKKKLFQLNKSCQISQFFNFEFVFWKLKKENRFLNLLSKKKLQNLWKNHKNPPKIFIRYNQLNLNWTSFLMTFIEPPNLLQDLIKFFSQTFQNPHHNFKWSQRCLQSPLLYDHL